MSGIIILNDQPPEKPAEPTLDSTVRELFEHCSVPPPGTQLGIYAFPPEHGRERCVFVANGPEAGLFFQLLTERLQDVLAMGQPVAANEG